VEEEEAAGMAEVEKVVAVVLMEEMGGPVKPLTLGLAGSEDKEVVGTVVVGTAVEDMAVQVDSVAMADSQANRDKAFTPLRLCFGRRLFSFLTFW
jgi:hypothetical protein